MFRLLVLESVQRMVLAAPLYESTAFADLLLRWASSNGLTDQGQLGPTHHHIAYYFRARRQSIKRQSFICHKVFVDLQSIFRRCNLT